MSGHEAATTSSATNYFTPPPPQPPASQVNKKKRSLPGNPDPDAEVIALSPKTLMATNRFLCEICGKGFQRDQNLQLHRRGHNLPWKLKQRAKTEVVRKKVYVCPEATCVHHDPARALGDLTGIKKHFSRKHGEKKWKCEKCSKKYAVQSDWKAHSKTCGTREYRCDCGTLFSRRDSFITHRAFCDALAEESARGVTAVAPSSQSHEIHGFQLKQEQQQQQTSFSSMPAWLGSSISTVDFSGGGVDVDHPNRNPNPSVTAPTLAAPSPHMSATALLQKAAQMGATTSTTTSRSHQQQQGQGHVSDSIAANSNSNSGSTFGLNLSSRDDPTTTTTTAAPAAMAFGHHHGFFPAPPGGSASASLLQHVMNSFEVGPTFEEAFSVGGIPIPNAKKDHHLQHDEGLTRDFLGLRPLSHSDILTIAGMAAASSSSSSHDHHHLQKPWQG
ncbi:Protein indeterminate-domain 7 [Stylosanthes scabra]|uniref:Protein indeterminate-domain 7 n=1 Tax=Stylosanthes scabra TaxID=79078 RepID=A0ABU6X6W2_9FABA|nr:Protein indeterminate-domain 7 [Stylosanthes scabra]